MPNTLFSGIEAEGNWAGFSTLFISSGRMLSETTPKLLDIIERRGYPHVYLGASADRVKSKEGWDKVKEIFSGMSTQKVMTVETLLFNTDLIPTWILDCWRIRLLVSQTVKMSRILKARNVELKLEDTQTALIYGKPSVVDLSYVHDKEITDE